MGRERSGGFMAEGTGPGPGAAGWVVEWRGPRGGRLEVEEADGYEDAERRASELWLRGCTVRVRQAEA